MDTSDIKTDAITTEGGLHLGDKDAPVKVVEFLNLRCPYSREWWDKSSSVLEQYIEDNKVERIIKFYDKDKPGLKKGNILHAHINYENSEQAKEDIDFYSNHLDEWGDLPEDKVSAYAEEKRGAGHQDNSAQSEAIINEAKAANVTLVPTVAIEDYVFDEKITEEELESIIEAKLKRDEKNE